MRPEEQKAFVEVVYLSFTEDEIENLEIYADHMFDMVERGVAFSQNNPLVTEWLEKFMKKGRDDE